MTRWEERIAGVFAGRFPQSAAAQSLAREGKARRGEEGEAPSENAAAGRAFRLRAEQVFPDFEAGSPEEKESFLEALEALERRGLVHIRWVRSRKGEALESLAFPDPEAFFAFMGKPSPAAATAGAREAAACLAAEDRNRMETGGAPATPPEYRELFRFLAANIKPVDAARGMDEAAVRDLARFCAFLAGGASGLTARALSIALYADSKRLEAVLALFARFLSAAETKGIPVPELSHFDRSFPETMIGGKLGFFFSGDTGPMENAAGAVIGLPLASIVRIRRIRPLGKAEGVSKPRVLTVENKETFYALAGTVIPAPEERPRYDAVLYAGGHPNRAVGALLGVLAASGFGFYHAGDLDIEGILILQELADMAGKPVMPVRMDRKTFEQYRCYRRRLEASMLRRASLIREETRNIPGIRELIELIEETGLGLEQEIIDSY